jgi:hypothetical protein
MADDLKSGIQSAPGGKVLNVGFLRGIPLKGFVVTVKKFAGPTLVELQKQADNGSGYASQ